MMPHKVVCNYIFVDVGAKQPSYVVTADDVDTLLALEVQPLDERKRKVLILSYDRSLFYDAVLLSKHNCCNRMQYYHEKCSNIGSRSQKKEPYCNFNS